MFAIIFDKLLMFQRPHLQLNKHNSFYRTEQYKICFSLGTASLAIYHKLPIEEKKEAGKVLSKSDVSQRTVLLLLDVNKNLIVVLAWDATNRTCNHVKLCVLI